MAEARKLAGRVSAESEVTPRRSFSLNIFLQEGERVNVFVPSCQRAETRQLRKSTFPSNLKQNLLKTASVLTSSGRLSVPMEMSELYSCSRSCLACRREVMQSFEIHLDFSDDTFSGRARSAGIH